MLHTTTRTPVCLRVWGRTDRDADLAIQDAGRRPASHRWDLVAVHRTISPACPDWYGTGDEDWRGSDYDRAWAAVRAPDEAPAALACNGHADRKQETGANT